MDNFPEQRKMTKKDIMIITGDFGGVWDYRGENRTEKYWLDWLDEEKSFTTVFVDGNHECFPRLQEYPVREFCGGKVHEIRPSVFHFIRGEIYEMGGKTFYAFGGAASHDIEDGILDPVKDKSKIKRWWHTNRRFRVNGVNWWPEEMPSEEEMTYGAEMLKRHGNKVNYVLSHAAPDIAVRELDVEGYQPDVLTKYFDRLLEDGLQFDCWLFGHYHKNQKCQDKYICLYEQMVRIL